MGGGTETEVLPSPCSMALKREHHTHTTPCEPRSMKVRPLRLGLCILCYQPGAPRHLPPLPPTAAWDKGWHRPRAWLGLGSPLPQLCSRQGPSWAGPGQYPSTGARVELGRVGASAEQGPHTCPSPDQAAGPALWG